MKRTFTLLAAAFATTAAAQKPYHRDLAVLEVNREAPRTEFVEFASRDEALTRSFEQSDAYRSLDGVWKFRYADDVRTLPADATAADADTSAWSDIRVPGNWELQGHGTPIYVNTRYEYATIDPAPPHLPEAIPAGVYRRTFTVPEAWAGRRIYLTIGGAKSGVYVYVNGREAGYNEDSKNPAQYRIDPLLRPGENTLALKMTRWSTGSYLEAQDFWRISGIERTVYLSAETPRRAARFRGRIDARRQLPHGAFHAENVPRRRSGGRGGLRTARSRGPHRRLGTAAGNGRSPVPCRDTRRSALDG